MEGLFSFIRGLEHHEINLLSLDFLTGHFEKIRMHLLVEATKANYKSGFRASEENTPTMHTLEMADLLGTKRRAGARRDSDCGQLLENWITCTYLI